MGKLHFDWNEKDGLVISQCDFINTDPKKCEKCEHRFECFTERIKANKTTLSAAKFPQFDDLLKHISLEFDEPEGKDK